ncbi:MAG TPA: hypothetical protein VFP84_27515, partial [Kofleriaceae bacterium]|nr:hypothetical protein [Kofleriaceae bacterium]
MASDPEQLNALVDELASDPAYATGKRKFPKPVSADDAVAIASGLQGEVDNGVARRDETIARQGMTLACHRGCNNCCTEPIMVFRPEALQIARWLKEHDDVRAQFLAAYPAWKQAIGDTPQKLSDLSAGDPKP